MTKKTGKKSTMTAEDRRRQKRLAIEAEIGRLYMLLNDVEAQKQEIVQRILQCRQHLVNVVPVKKGNNDAPRGNKPDGGK